MLQGTTAAKHARLSQLNCPQHDQTLKLLPLCLLPPQMLQLLSSKASRGAAATRLDACPTAQQCDQSQSAYSGCPA